MSASGLHMQKREKVPEEIKAKRLQREASKILEYHELLKKMYEIVSNY
jgi:hypothetical protein